jgi:hypothetical protein
MGFVYVAGHAAFFHEPFLTHCAFERRAPLLTMFGTSVATEVLLQQEIFATCGT